MNAPNPVVSTVSLKERGWPGWHARLYADGTYDAVSGRGITIGCDSLDAVVEELQNVRQIEERERRTLQSQRRM